MRIFSALLRSRPFSSVKQPSGTVYTWKDKSIEQLQLPENAKRVSLGVNHSAIVGQSGNLYTYGSNKHGQLGHGDKDEVKKPKLVEYFDKKNLKVKQALCGENHTLILTQDGNVYTVGHGGRRSNYFMNLFVRNASPLGHGSQDSISKPKMVKYFQNIKIERITAGNKFNFAIDEKGKIYFWGCGEYGVFGDGSTKNCNTPITNEYFQYLEDEEKITINKAKSCSSFTMALMTNGFIYGWGLNQAGQMGIKNQIGIELNQMVNYPHMMIRDGFEDVLVRNFDTSENITIFQLENNQLWWCGRNVAYKPERIIFNEEDNVKLFAAGYKSFAIVTNSNTILQKGTFIDTKGQEDIETGLVKIDGSKIFDGKEIVGIGGESSVRYAIVQ